MEKLLVQQSKTPLDFNAIGISFRTKPKFIYGIRGGISFILRFRNLAIPCVDYIVMLLRTFCGNNVVVFHTKNNKTFSGSKYLELKYLTIKDLVRNSTVMVEHVEIGIMLIDHLTKGLKLVVFERHETM
ncbi:hypothetical protein CR513_55422, partial [Mucuna pruriens]